MAQTEPHGIMVIWTPSLVNKEQPSHGMPTVAFFQALLALRPGRQAQVPGGAQDVRAAPAVRLPWLTCWSSRSCTFPCAPFLDGLLPVGGGSRLWGTGSQSTFTAE